MSFQDDRGTIRLAAVADIHFHDNSQSELRQLLQEASNRADVLVVAGDLTNRGLADEGRALAEEIRTHCAIPVVAVLGNHDFESGQHEEVARSLSEVGVVMLDEEPAEVAGVGFAGAKGFCGGFDRHALTPFGEQWIKDFVHVTVEDALRLESGLAKLRTQHKIAVLHYSPVRGTLEGEPLEIFPFLGSSRLAEPIDRYQVTAVLHGHAHNGSPQSQTLGGVPVYNVALPLMQKTGYEHRYFLLELTA